MRLLATQLPQSGFEDFQAGAVPGLVGKAVPISYGSNLLFGRTGLDDCGISWCLGLLTLGL